MIGFSMRFAKHGCKGNNKELVAEVVADMQDPGAPILGAARHGQRAHSASCVVPRFDQIADSGAASINQDSVRAGAVEIDVIHLQPPVKLCPPGCVSCRTSKPAGY